LSPFRCAVLAAVLLGLPLAGCGQTSSKETAADVPLVVQWRESKPGSPVGQVRAAVVERPALDRARIEARWQGRGAAANCALELVLPAGVVILEGDRRADLGVGETAGDAAWLVSFPTGRTLDAVVRLCGQIDTGECSAETTVRLVDAP